MCRFKIYKLFIAALCSLILMTSCSTGKDPGRNPEDVKNASASAEQVSVLFINAGKADSILVQVDGRSYLIDVGEKSSVPAIFAALENCGVKKLEGVFLTHTHSDHIGGLEGVSGKYDIDMVYSPRISENKKNGENKIAEKAKELELNHKKLNAGDRIDVSDSIYFEVLGPRVYNSDDDNDNSLVLRLTVNGKTFLFTGDMQFAEEKTLLDAGLDLKAEVLKVGNHGNPDATSNQFAKAVAPEIAVITTDTSVDTNSANSSVKKLLSGADIYLTEDYELGVLVTVNRRGDISVSNSKRQKAEANIEITDINKETQIVSVLNKGGDVDMSGYFLYSEKGGEIFIFPEGSQFKSGTTATVGCIGSNADYIWNEKTVWNKKKEDVARLYDKYGNVLSVFTSN